MVCHVSTQPYGSPTHRRSGCRSTGLRRAEPRRGQPGLGHSRRTSSGPTRWRHPTGSHGRRQRRHRSCRSRRGRRRGGGGRRRGRLRATRGRRGVAWNHEQTRRQHDRQRDQRQQANRLLRCVPSSSPWVCVSHHRSSVGNVGDFVGSLRDTGCVRGATQAAEGTTSSARATTAPGRC